MIHLYTAWSWYNQTQLDEQIQLYAKAGFRIILTVKYSPPAGHDGDVDGYVAFVRRVVADVGSNPAVTALVVGNEANVYGNPSASDGPFVQAPRAIASGVVAARQELAQRGSSAQVGFNFATTGSSSDSAFLASLSQIGGLEFASAVQFVGVDVYPGLWPARSGRPYEDTVAFLTSARGSVDSVDALNGLPLDILEIGAPTTNESAQAEQLSQFIQATLDHRERLDIVSLTWFDLWDADSHSTNPFSHYGLLRSDLSAKPAFRMLQTFVAAPR
jgi:hypothetical protein